MDKKQDIKTGYLIITALIIGAVLGYVSKIVPEPVTETVTEVKTETITATPAECRQLIAIDDEIFQVIGVQFGAFAEGQLNALSIATNHIESVTDERLDMRAKCLAL